MGLKLRIPDIPVEGLTIPVEVPLEKALAAMAEYEDSEIELKSPIKATLKVDKTGQRVLVKGHLETAGIISCSRCLEDFELPIAEDIFVIFSKREPLRTEEEIGIEDLSQEYYDGEIIDLGPIIYEQLILGLPIKPLCREDCFGICSQCGQNRNDVDCDCAPETGHPGMAALGKIKNKLPTSN